MADELITDPSLPNVATDDVEAAKAEGVKQAIADSAAEQYKQTDGNLAVEDNVPPKIVPTNDATHMDYLLDLEPNKLKDTLTGKDKPADSGIPTQGQIASLLEMERSGKNREDMVQALCEVLGVDSPYEVTDAGPNYTNVVARKALKR